MQDLHRYDDLIHRPRPTSPRHRPMPTKDRAAQFSPFAALVGLDAAIAETARIRASQVENAAYSDDMLLWDMEVLAEQLEALDYDPEEFIST